MADWYERTKGQPWEGDGLPWLYHKYAGHDTNRDWFMLNLKETQLLTHLLYHEWFPTMAYDVHQMGSRGARLFVPPFFDPINPNLDPKTNQGIFLIGSHMAADLATAGKAGVLTNAMYDNWWNGGMRTSPQRHNIVAVLTEAASVKLASPIFVEKTQLAGVDARVHQPRPRRQLRRPLARRLVAAPRHRRLRADLCPVDAHPRRAVQDAVPDQLPSPRRRGDPARAGRTAVRLGGPRRRPRPRDRREDGRDLARLGHPGQPGPRSRSPPTA